MFLSTKRSIVIPQSEHARLAGIIAALWGNAGFEKPVLPTISFIQGVVFHDIGFGYHDNLHVSGLTPEERAKTLRDGMQTHSEDVITDIVRLYHIRRLIADSSEPRSELLHECEQAIQEKLQDIQFQDDDFSFADHITELADDIAFDFSLEEDSSGSVAVKRSKSAVDITNIAFTIHKNVITLEPWPLSVDMYEGFIIGYEKDGYPESLKPTVVPFTIKRLK